MIKHLILPKFQNMMDIKGVLLHWFIILFGKKAAGGAVKHKIMQNKELAEKLLKTVTRKFEKRKDTHLL